MQQTLPLMVEESFPPTDSQQLFYWSKQKTRPNYSSQVVLETACERFVNHNAFIQWYSSNTEVYKNKVIKQVKNALLHSIDSLDCYEIANYLQTHYNWKLNPRLIPILEILIQELHQTVDKYEKIWVEANNLRCKFHLNQIVKFKTSDTSIIRTGKIIFIDSERLKYHISIDISTSPDKATKGYIIPQEFVVQIDL